MKKINKIILIIIIVALFLFLALWLLNRYIYEAKQADEPINSQEISSFEDCVAAGYPMMESYPRQCSTADGLHFTEIIEANSDPSLNFQVPDTSSFQYASFRDWQFDALPFDTSMELNCEVTDLAASQNLRRFEAMINDVAYCIEASSEGAAGSVYTEYKYTRILGDYLVNARFTVQYPNCQNYSDSEALVCAEERENMNMNEIIASIFDNLN